MKTYNKKKADQLTKDFQILAKTDITNQTNQTEWVVLRSLYYKVLKDFNNMNDQRISDYLLSIDICKDRSSIHVARAKVDLYYDQFDFFRDAYNLFFHDKEVLTSSKKEVEVVNEEPKDALEALIRTIPSHRRDEVLEMVDLRIKSWEWKSKDSCKVMVCFDGISNYAY
jgi:hypothetical protein